MKDTLIDSPLSRFLAGPNPAFDWTLRRVESSSGSRVGTIRLTSQEWRGMRWEHDLFLIRPTDEVSGTDVLLLVTGSEDRAGVVDYLARAARNVRRPAAVLFDVPNQPLFEGRTEDGIIAYTFARYLETGDETWPLLFPMTRSAQSAMTALQSYSSESGEGRIERFIVTGASKRGWTTWLIGAADERVSGIAPMVFNNLNMVPQMRHQLAVWETYSSEINVYVREGVLQHLETPAGQTLSTMVDPYTFRGSLTIPKLLIHGANDPYWPLDAESLYFEALSGDKHLLTIPNNGHGLGDREAVLGAISAFFLATATGRFLPELNASFSGHNWDCRIAVESGVEPEYLKVWTATAEKSDFRQSLWFPHEIPPASRTSFTARLPKNGRLALFAEAGYRLDGLRYSLSTPLSVMPSTPAEQLP